MKNGEKNTFNRWGMLMQIILVKLTLYLTEKCQKRKKVHLFISWQNPVEVKKYPQTIKQF